MAKVACGHTAAQPVHLRDKLTPRSRSKFYIGMHNEQLGQHFQADRVASPKNYGQVKMLQILQTHILCGV